LALKREVHTLQTHRHIYISNWLISNWLIANWYSAKTDGHLITADARIKPHSLYPALWESEATIGGSHIGAERHVIPAEPFASVHRSFPRAAIVSVGRCLIGDGAAHQYIDSRAGP
jgi:hypothetical protein